MDIARPSFPEIYMGLARSLAARSTCTHARVGTVITSADFRKVLAVGYSGNANGLPNHCDRDVPFDAALPYPDCGCLHSEENAIIQSEASREEPKIVFVTQFPCRACVKRMIQLGGVVDIYFDGDRESTAELELMELVGIRAHRLPPAP